MLQTNGDFVVRHRDGSGDEPVIWMADRDGNADDGWVEIQADGNLVLYDDDGDAEWASGTDRDALGDYALVMQDDGNLVVYNAATNDALWSTQTGRIG